MKLLCGRQIQTEGAVVPFRLQVLVCQPVPVDGTVGHQTLYFTVVIHTGDDGVRRTVGTTLQEFRVAQRARSASRQLAVYEASATT